MFGTIITAANIAANKFDQLELGQKIRAISSYRLPLRNIQKDISGSIAVEFAFITPIVVGGMLLAASMGFGVYKHQKLFSGAYAGASFMQDEIANGDFYKLRTYQDENGNFNDGEIIRVAKIVIKDASGLPINVEDINIDTYCGCPAVGAGNNGEISGEDFEGRNDYYHKYKIHTGTRKQMCTYTCSDSKQARILAEIDLSYTSTNLLGESDVIKEHIVTRLR